MELLPTPSSPHTQIRTRGVVSRDASRSYMRMRLQGCLPVAMLGAHGSEHAELTADGSTKMHDAPCSSELCVVGSAPSHSHVERQGAATVPANGSSGLMPSYRCVAKTPSDISVASVASTAPPRCRALEHVAHVPHAWLQKDAAPSGRWQATPPNYLGSSALSPGPSLHSAALPGVHARVCPPRAHTHTCSIALELHSPHTHPPFFPSRTAAVVHALTRTLGRLQSASPQ